MRVPLWLKVVWTVWLVVWAPLYWWKYGAQNFLFFCDIGNVLIGVGLWLAFKATLGSTTKNVDSQVNQIGR